MFTGIVEAVGTVCGVEDLDGLRRLRIETPPEFLGDLRVGASVAVDGACLTPVQIQSTEFLVEVVGTTLSRTVAGAYSEGSRVNLEKALAIGERLDGHLVQGHVDGIGHLVHCRDEGEFRILVASIPKEVHSETLLHGSIALNGVSLTVNRLEGDDRIEVAVIPHTWEATNLRHLAPGAPLNVEGDLIGKYVGKLLQYKEDGPGGGSDDALGSHRVSDRRHPQREDGDRCGRRGS